MKITALKVQARNKSRVNVYLDGKFAFGLVKIEAAHLRVGQALSAADLTRLRQVDEAETIYERALRFLATRPRSVAEIRQRLRRDEVSDEDIRRTLERLERAGLVNDQAFANYWVENRTTFRPKSRRALRQELKRKGLADSEVEAALATTRDGDLAYRLGRQRAPRLQKLPGPEYRRKLGEYLARRGFDYEIIRETLERVVRELPSLAPDDKGVNGF